MVTDALGRSQSVLLLGGTSEIGLATVGALVARGAQRVILAGRDPQGLERAATQLRPGPTVAVAPFEVTRTDEHAGTIDAVFEAGDVDVVVMAVGTLVDQADCEAHPAVAVHAGEVNFVGPLSVCLHAARRLREQGHGTLVVISSVAAERPRRVNFVYGATKAGLDAFARGLSDALVGTGASVLVVRPGFVRTRMTAGLPEAPFAVDPEDVARAVASGVASGRTVVWVPPALRPVMAVLRHLPRPLFRRLRR